MAMDQGAPEPQAQNPGGASKLAADTHSNLMQFADLVGQKFPEEGQALMSLVSQFQQIVESLGQAPGAKNQGPPMPGTTSPEAGAANVQQAL
jgi:hypothetical protein